MSRFPAAVAALLLGTVALLAQPKLEIPKNMKPYFLGLLVTDKPLPKLAPEEDQALAARHLTYIRSQVEAGHYKVVGPCTDNGRIRGIVIVEAASIDEARRLLEADPMVTSGRLSAEIHPATYVDLSPVKTLY